MTRKQKIKALEAIRAGLLKPEDLQPQCGFVVFKEDGNTYTCGGKTLTEAEYQQMADEFTTISNRRQAIGLPAGYFILVK